MGNACGSIMWDIQRLLADREIFTIKEFDVAVLACDHPSDGDINYAMETDLNKLLVVVNLAPGIDQRIDGNHRLAKAKALGIARISADYLSVEGHIRLYEDR